MSSSVPIGSVCRNLSNIGEAGSMHNELRKLALLANDLPEVDVSRDSAEPKR
jgi:hypothetical protein